MSVTVKTEPVVEPVSLEEAKLHLRVDGAEDDTLISSLIKAARRWCEKYQNRCYVTQTLELRLDAFPDGVIEIPRPLLQSIASIKYIDADGTEQVLAVDQYVVDTHSYVGRVSLAFSCSWPVTQPVINAVTIEYDAGYGDADKVPDEIKSAIKLVLGHLYENREDSTSFKIEQLPMGARSLLSMDRVAPS